MFCPDADLFFKDPKDPPPEPPTRIGVLYQLRREIRDCLSNAISWPGTMAVLAGIDLLAKFYVGDDAYGDATQRFRQFVRKYFALASPGDDEIIYQFRNAFLHSFGLYSRTKKRTYDFGVTLQRGPIVYEALPDHYLIDLITLFGQFELAVNLYASDLNSSAMLQSGFRRMFEHYGQIMKWR